LSRNSREENKRVSGSSGSFLLPIHAMEADTEIGKATP